MSWIRHHKHTLYLVQWLVIASFGLLVVVLGIPATAGAALFLSGTVMAIREALQMISRGKSNDAR